MSDWKFYIIQNNYATYAGVSPDPVRRLRQHNGEIKGGAKYTTARAPGWRHICIVSGFHDKIQALQFEWAVKHYPPRNAGGIINRIKKLIGVLNKERWTGNSPEAKNVYLTVSFNEFINVEKCVPEYVLIEEENLDCESPQHE